MKYPSLLLHLRDILILPFTVTVIIPFLYRPQWATGYSLFKIGGVTVGLAGLLLFLNTVFLFQKVGKGTLAPWTLKQKLVVVGPYRYCRNPMITGVLGILAGESVFFHSTDLLTWMAIFFAINVVYFIAYEEPALEERFGEAYREYKQHVPRWIPRITPYKLPP